MTFTRPFDPSLLDILEAHITEWAGECWRQVFQGTEPLKANVRGGRWNPPNVEALYTSLSIETATAEIDYLASRQPRPIIAPRVTYRLRGSFEKVVNLPTFQVLEPFGLTVDLLFHDNLEASQHVGDAVYWLGCEALCVPSARHRGNNLVIFMNNLANDNGLDLLEDS